MIQHSQISDINTNTPEGQLLMAAVAILTSIEHKHITSGKWGSNLHPDKALKQLTDLTNKIYYEKEWEEEQKRIIRDEKINNILRNNE
jgi:predicted metalloendopeptidase